MVRAEYVVNAAGLWAREVARLMDVELPIVPLEHQYLITNEIPQLATLGTEIPYTVDFDGAVYLRQEGKGLLVGTYEQDCRHWASMGRRSTSEWSSCRRTPIALFRRSAKCSSACRPCWARVSNVSSTGP